MARTKKSETPAPFDVSALDLSQEAELPAATRVVASRKWDDNPFVEPLRATLGTGLGRQVIVPGAFASTTAGGIRDAANKLTAQGTHVGARIVFRYTDDNGELVEHARSLDVPRDDRQVAVIYGAKPRKRTVTDLSDAEKEEATKYGFLTPKGRVQVPAYLDWVGAGRPLEGDGEVTGE